MFLGKSMYSDTFWETTEVTSWSQGGDYAHYIDVRTKSDNKGTPLSKASYNLLCVALNYGLQEFFQKESVVSV